MKRLILLGLVVTLFLSACDRFEHNFEPETPAEDLIEEFFNDFNGALDLITAADVAPVMEFYHIDYNNDNIFYDDVEDGYLALFDLADNITIDAVLLNSRDHAYISWQLLVYNADTQELIFDDPSLEDVLLETETGFIFYGNQPAPPNFKKVLVELATGTWCNGCPYAEEALHNLKSEFGDQFSYLEYHISDVLEVDGNTRAIQYYGISALPASVFQGSITASGGDENTEEIYRSALLSLFEQDAEVIFSNFGYSHSRSQLDCSINIEIEPSVSTTDLMMKYTLVEIESDVLNYDGDNCLQVPLVNGEFNLDEYDLIQPVDFSFDLPENLPDDINLIIWVQTVADTYNPETCVIHNVIEEEIIIGS